MQHISALRPLYRMLHTAPTAAPGSQQQCGSAASALIASGSGGGFNFEKQARNGQVLSDMGSIDSDLLPTFETAFPERQHLKFHYLDAKSRQTRREVEPQAMLILLPLWYLVASERSGKGAPCRRPGPDHDPGRDCTGQSEGAPKLLLDMVCLNPLDCLLDPDASKPTIAPADARLDFPTKIFPKGSRPK